MTWADFFGLPDFFLLDPFNRQPLKMEMLQPCDELKQRYDIIQCAMFVRILLHRSMYSESRTSSLIKWLKSKKVCCSVPWLIFSQLNTLQAFRYINCLTRLTSVHHPSSEFYSKQTCKMAKTFLVHTTQNI